jgi:hypothetical protein
VLIAFVSEHGSQDTPPASSDLSVENPSLHSDINDKVSLNGSFLTSAAPSFASNGAEGDSSAAGNTLTTSNNLFSHMGTQFRQCSIGACVDASIDDFEVSCDEVLMEGGKAGRTIEEQLEETQKD